MSKGALIFAYNNGAYDYVKMADLAAGLIKKHLSLPTTLVTDSVDASSLKNIERVVTAEASSKNSRVFKTAQGNTKAVWKNLNRSDAYDITPYDQTLLVDSDYLVFSDRLQHIFETDSEFACFKSVSDITGRGTFDSDKLVGKHSLDMLWATAVYFTKTERVKSIFEFVKVIRENYRYYGLLCNFSSKIFRNDFAFSIADHAISETDYFPWPMQMLSTDVEILEFRPARAELVIKYPVSGQAYQYGVSRVSGVDVHVMNKESFHDVTLVAKLEEYIDA